MTEICARCGQPTETAHTWALDGGRYLWRLCCLCTGELIRHLDRDQEASIPVKPKKPDKKKKTVRFQPCWSCRVLLKHHPGVAKPRCGCSCAISFRRG